MEEVYNIEYYRTVFIGDHLYTAYSDYVKSRVNYLYYERVQDASLVPWKQVILFQYLTQYADSEWARDILEETKGEAIGQDLRDCQAR